MSGRYLFDTNIIIALFGNDIAVNNQLGNAEEIFIPSVAIGELFYGARKSGRSPGNLERIEEFIARNTVIGCDLETARQYGELRINCVFNSAKVSVPSSITSQQFFCVHNLPRTSIN